MINTALKHKSSNALSLVTGENSNHFSNRKSLLIVDDNDSVRHALRRELELEKHLVFEACNAPEALALLENHPIDMVLSDQRMPILCGFRLLTEVRKKHPHCLRVLISGYTDFSSLVSAVNDAQITAFINKPWDSKELRDLIAEAFEQQEQHIPKQAPALKATAPMPGS